MRASRKGFTLVELIVVLGVIAILAVIGTLGYGQYQADGRDAIRSARATAIAEALEKYYDKHGEYPSCSQLTQTPLTVRSSVLVDIDTDILKAPRGNENSITCADLTGPSDGDYFAYVGDDSESCVGTSGNACVLFQLKYLREGDNSVSTIDSRRKTKLTSDAIPSLTVNPTGVTTASASWTAAIGATRYEVQYSKTLTFPPVGDPNTMDGGTLTTTSLSTSVTGLDQNTQYYFRVRALNAAGPAGWSTTKTASTYTLGVPAVTSSVTATQITVSWPAVTYATGYRVEYAATNTFTSSTVVDTTNTSHSITVTTGTTRYFRVRTLSGPVVSGWSSTITATAVPAPTTPTVTRGTETTTSVAFSWSSQVYLTRFEYQSRINNGSWSSVQNTTSTSVTINSTNGAQIDLQVRAVNPAGTSPWSTISTGYLIPATPTASYSTVTTSSIVFGWTASTGAARYEYQTKTDSGAWSGSTPTTSTSATMTSGTQGTRFDIQVRAVNVSGNASSWSASVGSPLSISTPAWNAWSMTESYPYWYTKVKRGDNGALCASGMELWTQFNEGISPGWNGWGAFSNRGAGATESATYTSNVSSYYATLQVQIGGYCRNPSSGAVSSTLYTGVNTAVHTQPTITLAGPTSCQGTYNPGGSGPGYAFALVLAVDEVSYNLDANTSNVNWSLYRLAIKNGWQSFDQTKTWPWSVNVNGPAGSGSSNSSRWRYSQSVIGETEGISSGTVTVAHDANGNATIGFSGSDGPGSTIFGSASCSGTYTLGDLKP